MDMRAVLAGTGCLVLLVTGVALLRDEPTGPTAAPPAPGAAPTEVASQPRWSPADLTDAPHSPIQLDLPTDPDPPRLDEDPVPAVVAAWARDDAGPLLLGTDGRWRSAPDSMETDTWPGYGVRPPAISPDGTRVAASTKQGLCVLDVETGDVSTIAWPERIAWPWDTSPDLRWLPGADRLLVSQWNGQWAIGLDGSVERSPYPLDQRVTDVFGVDPEGPVHQNDFPRSTLITWDGAEPVREVPFPQCERLVAAHGLVACTTGSLRSRESGPVVVDTATGEIVAYAPMRDPSSLYSDNGRLTALGFVDPDTVLLRAGTRHGPWYLATWDFRDGRFERVLRTDRDLWGLSITPALLG